VQIRNATIWNKTIKGDVSSMSDELGFPLDPFQNSETYVSYSRQYETVKKYVDHQWSLSIPTKSSPTPSRCSRGKSSAYRLVKWLIRHGIPMDLRAKLWYEYSGTAKEQTSNPELYSLLIWREAQDLQLGYSSHDNPVLSFVEMIDQGIFVV
jgi:hypothetical protein